MNAGTLDKMIMSEGELSFVFRDLSLLVKSNTWLENVLIQDTYSIYIALSRLARDKLVLYLPKRK